MAKSGNIVVQMHRYYMHHNNLTLCNIGYVILVTFIGLAM
jgi:hypothetical protein